MSHILGISGVHDQGPEVSFVNNLMDLAWLIVSLKIAEVISFSCRYLSLQKEEENVKDDIPM